MSTVRRRRGPETYAQELEEWHQDGHEWVSVQDIAKSFSVACATVLSNMERLGDRVEVRPGACMGVSEYRNRMYRLR